MTKSADSKPETATNHAEDKPAPMTKAQKDAIQRAKEARAMVGETRVMPNSAA